MAEKKVIAIMGATGAQGGGLVRAILRNPKAGFRVRAITRDAGSEKAQALQAQGAEVVSANLHDPAGIERAFDGAWGAYCVTFFWDHFSPERELNEARVLAEAAGKAGLRHVIWSTLEDTRKFVPLDSDRMPTLQGKYKVPHFDAKGEADAFFQNSGVPTTYLLASFYWENFIYFGSGPKPGPDGKLAITFPLGDARMAGIASEDIGKCAFGILRAGDEYVGRRVGIAGEHLTGAEMAKKLSKALGREVVYNAVTPETYRGFGFPGADDLGNMFQFYRDFEKQVNQTRSVEVSRKLNPELMDFDRWLAQNASRIPLD